MGTQRTLLIAVVPVRGLPWHIRPTDIGINLKMITHARIIYRYIYICTSIHCHYEEVWWFSMLFIGFFPFRFILRASAVTGAGGAVSVAICTA